MGLRVREDVAVPPGRIDELFERLGRIAANAGVGLFLDGHLGEGSFHPNFAVDPASAAGERIRAAVLTLGLEPGGTVSSEHGIGRLRADFLVCGLGPVVPTDLPVSGKRRCDPDGILNPGKRSPSATGPVARPSPSPSGSAAA